MKKTLWLYIRLPPFLSILTYLKIAIPHIKNNKKIINKQTTTTDSLHGNDAEHPMGPGRGPKFLYRL
jgi:hypothetical protein